LFVRHVGFHGWRSRVCPHVSAASCAAAGAPALAPVACARAPAAGASLPLLGFFCRLLLPCSCSCIRCFMGGCTCSRSGTGCGCFSAFVWGYFCGCCCPARGRASAALWAVARARARAPAAGASPPLFGAVSAAVAAMLVVVHPLLYGRLHVLVLGHWPPVFLRSITVRLCGWCFRARAAEPTASGAAAGALTRASCVLTCAAVFLYSHPFLLAVFHLAMSRRTMGVRYLLCFSSQADYFMTRKRERGVLKAPKKETVRALTSLSLLVYFMESVSQCNE